MVELLDAIQLTIKKWTSSWSALRTDAAAGDTVLHVFSTVRYREGDEILIRAGQYCELGLTIVRVVDQTHIEISPPLANPWAVANQAGTEKTWNQNLMQSVHIGTPATIPMFPAVCIELKSRDSQWLTLKSTKQKYNVEITVYTLQQQQQQNYRDMMRLTDEIQWGLKNNLYTLARPYTLLSLTEDYSNNTNVIYVNDVSIFGGIRIPDLVRLTTDVNIGDTVLNVANTSEFHVGESVTIQDGLGSQSSVILNILNGQQLQVAPVSSFYSTTNRAEIRRDQVGAPFYKQRIFMEDHYHMVELLAERVDTFENSIYVNMYAGYDFLMANGSKVIVPTRFFFNSWNPSINVGTVFKGSLLKAAVIQAFFEEQVQMYMSGHLEPKLT